MKAAQITAYGDPSVVRVNEIERPVAGEGQVLIEVYASSLNPFDTLVRSGAAQKMAPLRLPATLGGDVAGVAAEVGAGVAGLAVGDRVYGQASAVAGNSGALAEFATTAAGQVAKMPADLDFEQAASLPLVGVSALQALTEHIKLGRGQKILIIGGSGGIGTVAIQLAKHLGAYVTATATGAGLDLATRLDADEVIDYKDRNFADIISGYDAVFDTAGGANFEQALRVLKKGGVAVSMAAQPNEALARELGVTAIIQMTRVSTDALNRLSELIGVEVIAPQVGKVFALEDVAEAFRARESGGILGKVVIQIR